MKKSAVVACLVVVLAAGGAVAWGFAGDGDAPGGRTTKEQPDVAAVSEAGQDAGSAPGAAPQPAAKPGQATAAGKGVQLPTIPLPSDPEQAKKVAALNQVIATVTQEAMKRPQEDRMTQEELSELIRTRIKGVIPDQSTKGARQGDS